MQASLSIRSSGTEALLIRRLEQIKEESPFELIPFSFVFHRLCSYFSIKRKECWDLLYYMQDRGMVKIVPFHGVRIG